MMKFATTALWILAAAILSKSAAASLPAEISSEISSEDAPRKKQVFQARQPKRNLRRQTQGRRQLVLIIPPGSGSSGEEGKGCCENPGEDWDLNTDYEVATEPVDCKDLQWDGTSCEGYVDCYFDSQLRMCQSCYSGDQHSQGTLVCVEQCEWRWLEGPF